MFKTNHVKIISDMDSSTDMGLTSSPQGNIVDARAPIKTADARLAAIARAKGTEPEVAWSKLLGELITLMGGRRCLQRATSR